MTTRRDFLQASGALVVAFSMGGARSQPMDAWIRVDANKEITIFTGKAELGQGIKTALLQIAAEELEVEVARIRIVTADTAATPNEGYTAGSNSLKDSGTAIRQAAAEMRALMQSKPVSLRDPRQYRVVGKHVPRVDIPAKVTGGAAYVHDMRLPDMLHARVVPPPSYGAELIAVDASAAEKLGAKVVRDGNFLAVVAEREWTAVKAMRALTAGAQWKETASLPDAAKLPDAILALQSEDVELVQRPGTPGEKTLEATYTRAYQMHASMGPSCALAHLVDGQLTVWSHTQGVYPDRAAIAEMLGMPEEKVRVVHAEGAGCYGHNGADDAAADAALIASLMPGKPIRVQWMREHEHIWEPYGPAMVSKARASLDATGRIVDWEYGVWSNTHSTRPGKAGALLAGRHSSKAFQPEVPKVRKSPEGMGDRNAVPLYVIPGMRVTHHFLAEMPLRVSALRALGAYHNVFAIESFMDELAAEAGKDPVQFRLDHLNDLRAREVVRLAADKFGWGPPIARPRGRGFGFARYKNSAAFCAVAVEAVVDPGRGRVRLKRVVAAVDSGQLVSPDGLRNQVEGAILQSASWTLYERVHFDRQRIRSTDWSTYPILRFDAIPDSIEVHIIDRQGLPFLGSGECGQGPAAAAVANAVANATGRRLRDLPLRIA